MGCSGIPQQHFLYPGHYKKSLFLFTSVPFYVIGLETESSSSSHPGPESVFPITALCSRDLVFTQTSSLLEGFPTPPVSHCQALLTCPDKSRSPQCTELEPSPGPRAHILPASASPRPLGCRESSVLSELSRGSRDQLRFQPAVLPRLSSQVKTEKGLEAWEPAHLLVGTVMQTLQYGRCMSIIYGSRCNIYK